MEDLRQRLEISKSQLDAINDLILNPDNETITALLDIVAKYGTPDEINQKAAEARKLDNLLGRLGEMDFDSSLSDQPLFAHPVAFDAVLEIIKGTQDIFTINAAFLGLGRKHRDCVGVTIYQPRHSRNLKQAPLRSVM